MDEPFLLYFRSMSTHFKTGFNGFFKNLPEIEHLCRSGFASEVYRRLVDSLGTVEDGLINPVIQHLEKLGILDDTVIIIHSDHGDMLWNLEPDLQQNSKVGRWNMAAWTHNIEPYQGLIKVPLLISGTGLQGEIKDRFRLLDLTPTLLDVLDVPYDPMELDGHSLRYDKDRTLLYADSANYCELGGLSLQHQGQKLICSRRLGSVVYPVADQGYEEISTRDRDSKMVDVLRTFLLGHNQGMPSADDVDHEKILEDRLRGLGYI
jgi:membrane-anchored protein YejM (alkaline phosphatase superfamily)